MLQEGFETARQTPVSSFLQERLQKERRAESQKMASSVASGANSDLSGSVELGSATQQSPSKSVAAELDQPTSAAGAEGSQKKGLALKEMEQVCSTRFCRSCEPR